jgi:hypothetical protein
MTVGTTVRVRGIVTTVRSSGSVDVAVIVYVVTGVSTDGVPERMPVLVRDIPCGSDGITLKAAFAPETVSWYEGRAARNGIFQGVAWLVVGSVELIGPVRAEATGAWETTNTDKTRLAAATSAAALPRRAVREAAFATTSSIFFFIPIPLDPPARGPTGTSLGPWCTVALGIPRAFF